MAKTMKAAVVHAFGEPLRIEERPVPEGRGGTPGDWVAVAGIGGLGHMALQYARAMDLHVIAVDVAEERLAFAAEGKRVAHCSTGRLENVDEILGRLRRGEVDGRIVMRL